MENEAIQELLTGNAKRIHQISEDLLKMHQLFDEAIVYLKDNKGLCQAIGVIGDEPCTSELEEVLNKTAEEYHYLIKKLEHYADKYVVAMMQCGDFSDQWDVLDVRFFK